MINRGLYHASGLLTEPSSRHERGLVKAGEAKALIVLQSQLALACLLVTLFSFVMVPSVQTQVVSVTLGATLVWFCTCVSAKWAFRYRGAQQARKIYVSLWRAQIFKFFMVIAFFVWVALSEWLDPVAAILSVGAMQLTPILSGGLMARQLEGRQVAP